MGKIYYVMGKSASGKDTIFKRLLEKRGDLKTIIPYTTRPVRQGEREGWEYHFSTEEKFHSLEEAGKVIESRTYQTIFGPWIYFTVNDGQFDDESQDYLMIGTLESYERMQSYFGRERLSPVYIEVDDCIRLERALAREKAQREPEYAEVCRRYLADEKDFSEENLIRCGIKKRFRNRELEECLEEIMVELEGES